jgi:hypothetical protein
VSSLFRGEPRSPAPLRSCTLLGSCLLRFLLYVSLSRVKLGHDWPSVKFAALSGQSSSVVLLARAASAPLSSFVFSIRGTSLASLLSRLLPSVVPSQSPVTPFTPPNNETKRFLTSHFLVRSSVGRVHLRIPRERCPRVLSHGHGLLLHRSRSTVLITPPPLRTHANNKFATIGGSRICNPGIGKGLLCLN